MAQGTVEVWTRNGLVKFYIMTVMRLKMRRVYIAIITPSPDTQWAAQVTKNLTADDGFTEAASHLILDRDRSFRLSQRFLTD